jgi:UDP-N-acetylglucosamine--N-acetylmuramyl-(pentapeptide) pyrophosphoryl-undecaprenol N-acetylglucosamine transferase
MSPDRPTKTILFAGGGTGGHLFPGVALAEEFLARRPEWRVVFAGTERGLEARVIPELGWPLVSLDVYGLVGIGGRRRLKALFNLPRALVQALILLVRYRPSLIVGLGGYASAPVLAAAVIGGVPFVLQEQNAFPGVVNRLLAPFAARIYTAFPEAQKRLYSRRIENCGNPLRRQTENAGGRDEATLEPSPESGSFNLVVVGGSKGARVLNRVVPAAIRDLAEQFPGLKVVHQSGYREFESVAKAYDGLAGRVEVVDFIADIGPRYGWADLVISRAGALTLAELAAMGKPAILVPFPFAAHDHQSCNANSVAAAGAAWMCPEEEFTPERLARDLKTLMAAPEKLQTMAAAARKLARPGARQQIVERCLELLGCQDGREDAGAAGQVKQ